MQFPCPNVIVCPGSGQLEYDTPIANLTSELPDSEIFIGLNWGPLNMGGDNPPLGFDWGALGCAFACFSTISQEDADQCAQAQASLCTWNTWTPPTTKGTPGDPGPKPKIPVFSNAATFCVVNCPDGSPFQWNVPAGVFYALSQVIADTAAKSFACRAAAANIFCMSEITAKGCAGSPYADTIKVTGRNPGPFTFAVIAGTLPPGLTLTDIGNTALIAGIPTTGGTYVFIVSATDSRGNFMSKSYTIRVLEIIPATLPQANKNQPYSQTLTVVGGTGPFVWNLELGPLPAGLTLSEAGVISGTPTETGTFSITVSVTDNG